MSARNCSMFTKLSRFYRYGTSAQIFDLKLYIASYELPWFDSALEVMQDDITSKRKGYTANNALRFFERELLTYSKHSDDVYAVLLNFFA